MIEGTNPIPHILKDLENWSENDLALLIIYLNRGVYEQFIHKVLQASPEEFERQWPVYKKMKAEIINSQMSLLALEKYVDYRINDTEKIAMHKALHLPPITHVEIEIRAGQRDGKSIAGIIDAEKEQKNRLSLRSEK